MSYDRPLSLHENLVHVAESRLGGIQEQDICKQMLAN